jgi:hypothetical protein
VYCAFDDHLLVRSHPEARLPASPFTRSDPEAPSRGMASTDGGFARDSSRWRPGAAGWARGTRGCLLCLRVLVSCPLPRSLISCLWICSIFFPFFTWRTDNPRTWTHGSAVVLMSGTAILCCLYISVPEGTQQGQAIALVIAAWYRLLDGTEDGGEDGGTMNVRTFADQYKPWLKKSAGFSEDRQKPIELIRPGFSIPAGFDRFFNTDRISPGFD